MTRLFFLFFIFSGLIFSDGFGQISPPGLGEAETASWFAFAIRQNLDSLKQKQSVSYFGVGRISDPDNFNPYYKPAIIVLNQEFYHQFARHWQYSFAFSYRRQHEYEDYPPYKEEDPAVKQEFRLYGRLSYLLKGSRYKLVATYRQELRMFYAPHFIPSDEHIQLRSRFRVQGALALNEKKTHQLVASAEALFSISRKRDIAGQWTRFGYHESRFCFYYSFAPPHQPFIFDIGYMNNLLGNEIAHSVHYIALDAIWENPFKVPHKKKHAHLE